MNKAVLLDLQGTLGGSGMEYIVTHIQEKINVITLSHYLVWYFGLKKILN